MKNYLKITLTLLLFSAGIPFVYSADNTARIAELDAYWAKVSRSVNMGDFEGYRATCHPKGVLVSGKNQSSYPLTTALAGWKQGFLDTKEGKITAKVTFRFGQRLGDETTAHETGMFLYSTIDANGKASNAYIHFEALLVKEKAWTIMMEYQKLNGTKEEWNRLE